MAAPFLAEARRMDATLRAQLTLREQRATTTSCCRTRKHRRCNGAGKLEASKVLAAAANGTSPADEGEILSSFRGKTVDFPRTRNYFLALVRSPPFLRPGIVRESMLGCQKFRASREEKARGSLARTRLSRDLFRTRRIYLPLATFALRVPVESLSLSPPLHPPP